MPKVVPDWENSHAVVVDPAIWPAYRTQQCYLRTVFSDVLDAFQSLGVSYDILTKEDWPIDIWVRDWGPIAETYFEFCPSYARGWYSARAIAKARQNLARRRGSTPRRVPVVLDGGNLVHNGKVAIVTEKALLDNRHLSKREIERAIIDVGFERVVIIPVEPGDKLGHADGVARFLQSDVLLVNAYDDVTFRNYSAELLRRLRSSLHGVDIVPFPWFSEPHQTNGIWSAVGCYININLTGEGIIYPIFNHKLDDSVARTLSELSDLPARAISATPLAQLGGGLNCITL